MLWYGPGYIRPGSHDEPVTLADVAPTTGALLRYRFDAPDGRVLTDALQPGSDGALPRLFVTLVWGRRGP